MPGLKARSPARHQRQVEQRAHQQRNEARRVAAPQDHLQSKRRTTQRLNRIIEPTIEPCDRGVCAAGRGHAGTCDEASGWDVPAETVNEVYDRAYTRARQHPITAQAAQRVAEELTRMVNAARDVERTMTGVRANLVEARERAAVRQEQRIRNAREMWDRRARVDWEPTVELYTEQPEWVIRPGWDATGGPVIYNQQQYYTAGTTQATGNIHWNGNAATYTNATTLQWQITQETEEQRRRRFAHRERVRHWGEIQIVQREDRYNVEGIQEVIWTGWVRNLNTGEEVTLKYTAIGDGVWRDWNDDFEHRIIMEMDRELQRHIERGTRPEWELTDEQREMLERAEQERRDREQRERERINRERLAAEERKRGAKERAKELLMMVLTPEERLLHENQGEFTVRGSDGNLYLLQTTNMETVHGNIVHVDEHGCRLGRVCVAPDMYQHHDEPGGRIALPIEDGWVGQYLGLRHNAREFLSHGNWSERRPCQQPNMPVINRPTTEPVYGEAEDRRIMDGLRRRFGAGVA